MTSIERPMASAWLLRSKPRIGSWSIDERQHWTPGLLGQLHDADRFPVALGVCHPEVSERLVFRRPPLLVADDRNDFTFEACKSRNDRRIVPEVSVPMQFDEILEQERQVVP